MKFHFKRADLERVLIAGAAALVLLLAARGAQPHAMQNPYEEPYDQIPAELPTTAQATGPTQPTTLYFQDDDGYLVPVMKQIPKQDGVAKATLGLMVQDSRNDMEAARLGLRTVVPSGATFDLNIENGKARVDISREALSTADAEQEANMVSAIVHTLTAFNTVDRVEFLVDGQKRSKLTHGTDISGVMTGDMVNLESVSASTSLDGAKRVQLYFPSETGRVLIPVTRTVFSPADINTAVLELAKGPQKDSGLQNTLPSECGLIDVAVKDGIATINFTDAFAKISEQNDGGRRAIRALMLTCAHFPGIKQVKLQVNGKDFTLPAPMEQPTFVNSAEEVAQQFPGVMEVD